MNRAQPGTVIRPQLRSLTAAISALALLAGACPAAAQQAQMLLQSSPLAGFRHYHAPALWQSIRVGDPLTLVREPTNPHDRNAIRVDYGAWTLGYVPRAENDAITRQMDRGADVRARVSRVEHTRAPNRRIELEVFLPL